MSIKKKLKEKLIKSCDVSIVEKNIQIEIDSLFGIKYAVIDGKKVKAVDDRISIRYSKERLDLILQAKMVICAKLGNKACMIKNPSVDVNYRGVFTCYNGVNYKVNTNTIVVADSIEVKEDLIELNIVLDSISSIDTSKLRFISVNEKKETLFDYDAKNEKLKIKKEYLRSGGIELVALCSTECLNFMGENINIANYSFLFEKGKLTVKDNNICEKFLEENDLKDFPPLSPKYINIERISYDTFDNRFIVKVKNGKKNFDCLKVYVKEMKTGDLLEIASYDWREEITVDAKLLTNHKINYIDREFICFELIKEGAVIEANYFMIQTPKRRLLKDNVLFNDAENCICFYDEKYIVVSNKENYLIYDKKYELNLAKATFDTKFEIKKFEKDQIEMNLSVNSLLAPMQSIRIFLYDNYTKKTYSLSTIIFDELIRKYKGDICLRLDSIKEEIYHDMRLEFWAEVTYQNGYKEFSELKTENREYTVKERYVDIIDINDDCSATLYIGMNKFNLLMKFATRQELEKTIYSLTNREVYDTTIKTEEVDEKLLFFESNLGKNYSGNPKYLYEYMINSDEYSDYKFVWVYPSNKECPIPKCGERLIVVERESKEYFYYLAKAKYWINNIRFSITNRRSDVVYLNTWHGTPLKKLGFDIKVEGPEKQAFKDLYRESRNWDYLLADNDYGEEKLLSAFKFKRHLIKTGYPINDIYFDEKRLERVKSNLYRNYPQIKGKKVLLYAPTWRDFNGNYLQGFNFDLPFDIEKLSVGLGSEYVILVKLHHLIADNLTIDPKYSDFIINVSQEEDIMELLSITDILITDYSSVFYDFASARKPILFYMYDLDEYLNETRGLYVGVETLPGPIIKDDDGLLKEIQVIQNGQFEYKDKLVEFCDTMGKYCRGTSSKEVLDIVFGKEEKK